MSIPVVLFMKNATGYGWSERFWYAGPTDTASLVTNVQQLVVARAAILTNTCVIIRSRVANPGGVKRNPVVFTGNGAGTPGTETPPTASSEVALLILYQNIGVGFNRAFLRGIPERVVNVDTYAPDAAFNTNLNTFTAVLFNGLWNVRGHLSSAPQTSYHLSTIIPTPPRGWTAIPTPDFPGGLGQQLRVTGAVIPGYNGIKTITGVNTAGTLLTFGGAAPPVTDISLNILATTLGAFDAPLLTAQPVGISRRAAGRPFGPSRGRRQTLYSLRR